MKKKPKRLKVLKMSLGNVIQLLREGQFWFPTASLEPTHQIKLVQCEKTQAIQNGDAHLQMIFDFTRD